MAAGHNPIHDEVAKEDIDVEGRISIDKSGRIHLNGLPKELGDALEEFDTDGTGVCMKELTAAANKWHKSKGDKNAFELSCFPDSMQPLLKVFDQDGDGTVEQSELAIAAKMYADSQAQARFLKKMVAFFMVAFVVMLAAFLVMVYFVVDMSKESTVGNGGLMVSKDGNDVVRTMRPTVQLPLGMLPWMPETFLEQLDEITLDNEGAQLMRKLIGVDLINENSITLHTSLGDLIEVQNVTGGQITFAQGGNKELCSACSNCASVDVVLDADTEALLERYWSEVDMAIENGNGGVCDEVMGETSEPSAGGDGRRLRRGGPRRCRHHRRR